MVGYILATAGLFVLIFPCLSCTEWSFLASFAVIYCVMVVILQMAGHSVGDQLQQLQMWKRFAQYFVSCANQTINSSEAQHTQLHARCTAARESLVR